MQEWWNGIKTYLGEAAADAGLKIAGAAVLLILGFILIRWIKRAMMKAGSNKRLDKSLHGFLTSAVNIALNMLLLFAVAMYLGVPSASLLAVLGSAGLAVGLALQGSLSNFAGGVMVLAFRPFKVGDYIITKSGYEGTVEEISVFYTRLLAGDGKKVMLPNGELSNGPITNYTVNGMLRQSIDYGVHYETDAALAKRVILGAAAACPQVEAEPAPRVDFVRMEDSAIIFTLRVWCKSEEYFFMPDRLNVLVKAALDENGISIPYPQMDVHLDK